MNKIFYIILGVFLLIGSTQAYTLTWSVKDINTLQPIDQANITVREPTTPPNNIYTVYTNSDGLTEKTNEDENEHFYNVSKIGYYSSLNNYINTTNDTIEFIYLTPISTEGLVKVIWTDDLVNMPDRKMCVFYKENGRLSGCYGKNETIWLINNKEYIFEPQTNFYDFFTSIRSLWDNRLNLIPYLGISLFALFILIKLIRKK